MAFGDSIVTGTGGNKDTACCTGSYHICVCLRACPVVYILSVSGSLSLFPLSSPIFHVFLSQLHTPHQNSSLWSVSPDGVSLSLDDIIMETEQNKVEGGRVLIVTKLAISWSTRAPEDSPAAAHTHIPCPVRDGHGVYRLVSSSLCSYYVLCCIVTT